MKFSFVQIIMMILGFIAPAKLFDVSAEDLLKETR